MEDAKVLDKITKLLALSEGTHSQEEAQSAMLKVQELLLTHNLSMGDVSGVTKKNTKKEVDDTVSDISRPRMPWWWRNIATVIGENFKCYIFFRSKYVPGKWEKVKHIGLIGLKEDVEVATLTIKFALRTAESCHKAWKKEYAKTHDTHRGRGGNSGSYMKNDYMLGFISGLKERFARQVTEKALVIVKDALVEKTYNVRKKKMGNISTNVSVSNNAAAYTQGHKDGLATKRGAYIE